MKIVILDSYTENPGDLSLKDFEKMCELTVYEHTKAEDILNRIGDAELVITNTSHHFRNLRFLSADPVCRRADHGF